MKNNKRKLLPYEKALVALQVLMMACAVFFFLVYIVDEYRWAHSTAMMCFCVYQIASDCIRWEENTKSKKFYICLFSALFVIFAILLVWSLQLG